MKRTILLICMILLLAGEKLSAQQGGYALKFDGSDDYVSIPHNAALNVSQVTIEMWFYWSSASPDIDFLISKSTDELEIHTGSSYGLRFIPTTGVWLDTPINVISMNQWYHLAFVYDPSISYYKCYVNGVEKSLTNTGSNPVSTPLKNSSSPIRLGSRSDDTYLLTGRLDELRIWNTSRSETQIKENMYRELSGGETGMLAYYKMSNGSGTTLSDNSITNNTASLVNGAAWQASACFAGPRQALDFDGINDFVDIPHNNYMNIPTLTIEMWMYWTGSGIQFPIGKSTGQFEIHTGGTNGLRFLPTPGIYFDTPADVISTNQWYHIAFVYDPTVAGGYYKCYINGIEKALTIAAGSPATPIASSVENLHLGARYGPIYLFSGKLDEVRIWSSARTQAQIRENMMHTLAGTEGNLLVYYRMDYNNGSTLCANGYNLFNGSLTNMDPATDWVASSAFNTWIGSESSLWSTAANWSNGAVPASTDNIGIYKWNSLANETTLSGSPTVNNLLISSTSTPTIGSAFSVSGSLILEKSLTLYGSNANTIAGNLAIGSGTILTIPYNGRLTVTGTLTNNAGNSGLIIQSNATGTGSLIHNSASVGATVNRYISGNAEAWHFISSPVSGQAISGDWTPAGSYTDGTGYDFYAYSEPTNMWLNQKVGASNISSFNVGQGYMIAYQASNPAKTFAGNLNNGSTSIGITRSGTSTYVGSNLVGNPYVSSIDWKAATGWTRTNLVSNGGGYDLYIWNQTENNYGVYNSASGTDAGTNSTSRYIGPMQGFIVAAASSGNLIMDNNVRVHNNAGTWLKNTESESNTIRIKAISENGYGSDEAIVEYGHAINTGGAEKMFSFVETAPSVYLPKDNTDYSISFLTSVTDTYLVPLNFKSGADGAYRLEFTFDPSAYTMAEIEDHSTGIRQNLKENAVYSFSSGTTDAADRFTIHFGAVGINEDEAEGQLTAYIYNSNLYVVNESSKATLQLFDLQGRLVENHLIHETGLICHPVQIPSGVYVVRLQTEKSVKTAKVIVE